jgi:exonuclease VII small subunit
VGFFSLEVFGRAMKCKENCMAEILEREERVSGCQGCRRDGVFLRL